MITEFKFPDVGEGITDGYLIRWFVNVGDKIKEDQAMVEIETAKAVTEIPSPRDGFVIKLHFKEDDEIKVGEVMVTLGDEDDLNGKSDRKDAGTVVGVLEEAVQENVKNVRKENDEKNEKKEAPRRVMATPAIRRIAKNMGLEISEVNGTGSHGRITEDDLKKVSLN